MGKHGIRFVDGSVFTTVIFCEIEDLSQVTNEKKELSLLGPAMSVRTS